MSVCPPCFPWKDLTAQSPTVIPTLSSFFCLSSIFNLLFLWSYCGSCRECSPLSPTRRRGKLILIMLSLCDAMRSFIPLFHVENHPLNTAACWLFLCNSCMLSTRGKQTSHSGPMYSSNFTISVHICECLTIKWGTKVWQMPDKGL